MEFISLNPEQDYDLLLENDVLAVFRDGDEKRNEIEQGMEPTEIAEIISDHFIAVIRQQFEEAKKEFTSSTQAND